MLPAKLGDEKVEGINRQKICRRDHLRTRSTADLAIDNVFANGYCHNHRSVPAPLNTIKVGSQLELCGARQSGAMPC
jgi:hypothetical protein